MNSSCKLAIVAALDREIAPLVKHWRRTQREYAGRLFTFYEQNISSRSAEASVSNPPAAPPKLQSPCTIPVIFTP